MSSALHAEPESAQPPSIVLPSPRTVGFIKHHALKHRCVSYSRTGVHRRPLTDGTRRACRMTIERRLVDAGFTIVKERQMQFSPDSDRDILEELFGSDAAAIDE